MYTGKPPPGSRNQLFSVHCNVAAWQLGCLDAWLLGCFRLLGLLLLFCCSACRIALVAAAPLLLCWPLDACCSLTVCWLFAGWAGWLAIKTGNQNNKSRPEVKQKQESRAEIKTRNQNQQSKPEIMTRIQVQKSRPEIKTRKQNRKSKPEHQLSILERSSTILATGRPTHLMPEALKGPYQCS